MLTKSTLRRLGIVGLIAPALALAVACSGGNSVSKTDYDKVRQQLQDTENQNQQLQAQVAAAQKAVPSPAAAAAGATPAASAAAQPASNQPAGIKLLLGAYQATPAPPPPTPAANATPPPPRPTAPAALYDPIGPYYVYVEVLATSSPGQSKIVSNIACTPSGTFARGQKIVWRYEIVDIATGKRITNLDGATIKVLLPNDVAAAGSFSQRGGGSVPGAPFMWSSNWEIPQDYPLGAIAYSIQITPKDGKPFTWSPPIIAGTGENSGIKVIQ